MSETELIRLLEANAYGVYLATLVGNPCEYVKRLHERIKNPQPGDMVLEISTVGHTQGEGSRLGRMIRDVREPCLTPEQIAEYREAGETDEDYFARTERIVYVETLDGREYRWRNADFITVGESLDFFSMRNN